MSKKLLTSIADEKPADLQKQLGCMNGIFQLFDRHHFLPARARRHIHGHNHKRLLLPGQDVKQISELNINAAATEKRPVPEEVGKMKQIVPATTSDDCNEEAAAQSTILPMKKTKNLDRRSHTHLQDVVKESIYREVGGLSVKTTKKEEARAHAMKHIDSPRPLQQFKPARPRVNSNFDGGSSPHVLANKLRDAPLKSKEDKYGSLPREAPRFSYDERVSRDALKSTTKLKELPRLSLDSTERSIRSSASESRSNYISRVMEREDRISAQQILYPNQEPGSNKRPSLIVARLMGLEAIPDYIPTEVQMMNVTSCIDEDSRAISRSSKVADENQKHRVSGSPRVPHKGPASPRLRNDNLVTRSTSTSRYPLEPAPWRQDGNLDTQKQSFKYDKAPTTSPLASPSVYGEIEKRLTELEFKKSGKDLRALKQILEAMQKSREILENKKEQHSFDQGSTPQNQQSSHPGSPIITGTTPRRSVSQIMIIKPIKLLEEPAFPTNGISALQKIDSAENKKDFVGLQRAKKIPPRDNMQASSWPQPFMDKKTNARNIRSQYPKAPQHKRGENPPSFGKCSINQSPRLPLKKHGIEKQCHPTTQSSEQRQTRRQSTKQPNALGTPTRKLKPKSNNFKGGNDQLSRFSSEISNSTHQSDTVSKQSESSISSLQNDTEVTSKEFINEIASPIQPNNPKEHFMAKTGGKSIAEVALTSLEQPSPVSVLDHTFYEDSPSPVKKISTAFQDDATLSCDEAEWNTMYIDHLHNSTSPSSMFNYHHLAQKPRLVNFTHDEAAKDHIASLFDNTTNPDHIYIAEILLAAGLLKDLSSGSPTIQLLQSGYSINPYLFNVLEKTKGDTELADEHHEKRAWTKYNKKIQRRLLFDAVNEILGCKSALEASAEFWIFQSKLKMSSTKGEELLREMWSHIDRQQANTYCSLNTENDEFVSILSADMTNQSEDWTGYHCEFPEIVLDIERLIFKDLIGEVVSGEAAGLQMQPGRHCRQLFTK